MGIEEAIIPSFPGAAIIMLGQIVPITCLLPVIFGMILNRAKVLIQAVGKGSFYFTSPNINAVLSQYLTWQAKDQNPLNFMWLLQQCQINLEETLK